MYIFTNFVYMHVSFRNIMKYIRKTEYLRIAAFPSISLFLWEDGYHSLLNGLLVKLFLLVHSWDHEFSLLLFLGGLLFFNLHFMFVELVVLA